MGAWEHVHLAASGATNLAVTHTTGSHLAGYGGALAVHYLLDMGPMPDLKANKTEAWIQYLITKFRIHAVFDCLVGWGAVTVIGLLTNQSWLFWLGAFMGFWPDLDKILPRGTPQKWQIILPLKWEVMLHDWAHNCWPTRKLVGIIIWGVVGLIGSYLFLWYVANAIRV